MSACFYIVFTTCDNGSNPLQSDYCLLAASPAYFWAMSFTVGYMIQDLYILVYVVKDFGQLGVQFMVHHLIAIVGFLMAMHVGQGYPFTAYCLILNEFSTPFMNYR